MVLSGAYDVVVVGAGVMGSATAYQVAKRGHSVLLIEQFDFLHKRGSSHGETRTIRVTYSQDYFTFMMKEALQLWEEAQQEVGYMVHTQTPQLDMGAPDNKSLQSMISSCKKHGFDVEVLKSTEVSARFPVMELPEQWISVVTSQGGVIHAAKAVAMFQHLAAKHGAEIRDRTKVTKVAPDGEGVLVTTSEGSVVGRKCVLAAGAWTSKLVKDISGLELPVQPLHTTIAYWQIEDTALDAFNASSGFPSFSSYNEPHIYGNASIELPGLLKVNLLSGYNCDPDTRALVPDMESMKQVVGPWLAAHFKGKIRSDAPVVAEACMFSMTPDENFILDFLPIKDQPANSCESRSVVVAAGFSGHGLKFAPLVGRVMADLCLKESCDGVPLEHFSISRFSKESHM